MTVAIRAEVRYNSRLTDIERRFAIPLVEIAQQLVPGMLARIRQGRASVGSFAPLGAYSVPRTSPGLFWVPPKARQPAGYHVKPTSGKFAGWAGYESYKAYTQALGSPPRTFDDTGALLSALRIRVNGPGRVKVAFYGSHAPAETPDGKGRRESNASVAFLASRREPEPMLAPSRDELVRVAQHLRTEVNAQLIELGSQAQSVRGLSQRADRLSKRLPAQALGRR